MAKKRPTVDPACYDAAKDLLYRSGEKFLELRDDIADDLTWELAATFQTAYEDFTETQKLNG